MTYELNLDGKSAIAEYNSSHRTIPSKSTWLIG